MADAKQFEKTKHEDDVRRLLELKRSTDAVFSSVSRAVAVKKAAEGKSPSLLEDAISQAQSSQVSSAFLESSRRRVKTLQHEEQKAANQIETWKRKAEQAEADMQRLKQRIRELGGEP